jgi:hypothetical protein
MDSLCVLRMLPRVHMKGTHTIADVRVGMFKGHGEFFPRNQNDTSWNILLKVVLVV